MITVYKYYMTINDVEFDDVYDYEGLFEDHFEADRFLTENENVGNTIIIHKIEEIEVDPAVLNQIFRD
jgi:hypothetical protein